MTKQGSVTRRASVALLATMATGTALSQGFPPQAAPGIKKALCVGNSRYVTRPLKNPVNDARSVGSALRELGFEVTLVLDSTLTEMREAFRMFFEQSKNAETAFIFYAGHGFEVNGTNYLIPSDANPSTITSSDIAQVGFSMRNLTAELERSRAIVRVVVIDACRDTPKRGPTLGMQQMTAKGTLLAFSTSPGYLAEDSMSGIKTGNSPYTFALTESLRNRDLTLKEMFNRAHNTVAALTQERQIPWVHDGMTGDVRLYDSKMIVNAAAVNSNQLATVSRSNGRGSRDQELASQGNQFSGGVHALDDMTPRAAREKLNLLGYKGTDENIANNVVRLVDVESANLCVIAGIKLKFVSNFGDFFIPAKIVEKEPRRVAILLPKIKKSGVDIDEASVQKFYPLQLANISDRPFKIFKDLEKTGIRNPDDVRLEYGLATYDFELSLVSYALWMKKYEVVEALLKLGASLESEIIAIGYDHNFLQKRTKVSTARNELKIIKFRH